METLVDDVKAAGPNLGLSGDAARVAAALGANTPAHVQNHLTPSFPDMSQFAAGSGASFAETRYLKNLQIL